MDVIKTIDMFYKKATDEDVDEIYDWMEKNVKHPKGNCFFYSALISLLFPKWKLMKGKPNKKGDTAHFWVENKDGIVIDPSKGEFQTDGKEVSAKKNIDEVINHELFESLSKDIKNKIKKNDK